MRDRTRRRIARLAALTLAACLPTVAQARPDPYDPYRNRSSVGIGAAVRDFVPAAAGGHPDFGRQASRGGGRYLRIPAHMLGADNKPVFSTTGRKLLRDWLDADARPIIYPTSYIQPRPGDTLGDMEDIDGGAITSAATFAQWFRNVRGVNTNWPAVFRLDRNSAGAYVFDGTFDRWRMPADYSYTSEVNIPFVYEPGDGWYISLATDGDVWLFIDGMLVIDGGSGAGLGSAPRSAVAVDRMLGMANTAVISAPDAMAASTNSIQPGAIRLANTAAIQGDAMVGPGGDAQSGIIAAPGAISGSRSALGRAVPMDIAPAAAGMPASQGSRTFRRQNLTWTGDVHFDNLVVQVHSVVTVQGTARVLVDGSFTIEHSSELRLADGARLELCVMGDVFIQNTVDFNVNTGDPSRAIVACLGDGSRIVVDNNTDVFAHLIAPQGLVDMGNAAIVGGTITARDAVLHNTARLDGMDLANPLFQMTAIMDMTQRIDLDRLNLRTDRGHRLGLFFANRRGEASHIRIQSNLRLLNVGYITPPLPPPD
jgi:fibro-slime domain-containing protein